VASGGVDATKRQPRLNAPVHRDDGVRGTISLAEAQGQFTVTFDDGSRVTVGSDALTPQADGSFRLAQRAAGAGGAVDPSEELVIPVVAEELIVEKEQVAGGKVRVHKRIETREEVVQTPTFHDEIRILRVPINQYIEGGVPVIREEDGVLVIPVIEEVVVTEKRLLLLEEVRVRKERAERIDTQTVTLRREVVDIERVGPEGPERRDRKP
jgi:uncharacterized protein (TIGR02271 family)